MGIKPYSSRVQDLVYQMDVGIGLQVIKRSLYFIAILVIMLLYTVTQFHGFREAEAMEYAQLGRNLSIHKQLVTQCVRPASMWYLRQNSSTSEPRVMGHPDILHPPVYPMVLAAAFLTARVSFPMEGVTGVYAPDKWVVWLCGHPFTLLTGVMVFLLGKRLFDRRVAFLGLVVFFLSEHVWAASVSGTGMPLLLFLATAATYLAVLAGGMQDKEEAAAWKWLLPLFGSVILSVLAFLTRYGAIVIAPMLALYIGLTFKRRNVMWAVLYLVVFLLGISPWLLRNLLVSGGLLGLAPYMALENSGLFNGDLFERTLNPELGVGRVLNAVRGKWVKNFNTFYSINLRTIGAGFLICLFLATYFHRFVRKPVQVLRWCAALGILLTLLLACSYGETTARLLSLFWPVILLYGLAFFVILLDRLNIKIRLIEIGITVILVLLTALPLILTLLPPRASVPYPPYFPPFILHVSRMLTPQETMCTDMPWATAWYGQRNSLLLPATLDEFYEINDYQQRVSGLYFTTLTRDKPYVRSLLTGSYRTWFPILEGRIPSDFPLAQGFPLGNMDQMFLTDRPRWQEKGE